MQRDQKVGLALGVLLIGVVAAFFFRNETDPAERVPSLSRAEEVNREIAEKRLSPYFSEIEADELPGGGTAPPQNRSDQGAAGERKLPRWQEVTTERDGDPFAGASPERDVPAPDPIRYESATAGFSEPREDRSAPTSLEGTSGGGAASSALRSHVVQPGETLSSIAGKYLGSQARYREIFESNRDQLRSADDLQVGMKLRIPDAKGSPAPRPQPTTSAKRAKTPSNSRGEHKPVSADSTQQAVEKSATATDSLDGTPDATPSEIERDSTSVGEPTAPKLKFTPSKRRPLR